MVSKTFSHQFHFKFRTLLMNNSTYFTRFFRISSNFPHIHSDERARMQVLHCYFWWGIISLPQVGLLEIRSIFRCFASLIFLTYITLHSSYHNCSSSLTTLLRTMYTLHYNRKEKKMEKKPMGTSVNPSWILYFLFRIFWNNFSMGRKILKQWTLYEQSKVY